MRFTPRPWQPAMMDHIADHPRCAVWAHPGAGKTGATLAALRGIRLLDEHPGLILAPKRVARGVWPSEAAKWEGFGVSVLPLIGTDQDMIAQIRQGADFYTLNYEQIPKLVEIAGRAKWWPFKTIIADESTKLKSFRTLQGGKRARLLGKVAWLPQVTRWVNLTGTPAPNGLMDLWGQTWFLDKGERLGSSFSAFRDRWFRPGYNGFGWEPFAHSQEEIQAKLADICITIDPGDYIPIDEPIETVIEVDLPPRARHAYREMERKMFLEIEAAGVEVEAVNAATRTNCLLQLANGFIYHGDGSQDFSEIHDAKIEALRSIVEESGGMPVLVAYQFVADLAMLRKAFPQGKTLDDCTEEEWNDGRVPILFAHPASAGHGLNLQWGSNILVDYSSGWNLEHDDQVIERIGPMRQFQAGLNRPVYRYRLVAVDTVDEMVAERRASKASVQEILLNAMNRRRK